MPARLQASLTIAAVLTLPFYPAAAHVPFLRPQLSPLLRAAHCVAAARLQVQHADARGRHRVVATAIASWCGRTLPQPLDLELPTGVPAESWAVLFLRREGGQWQAIQQEGAALPLHREDFGTVHRALARAFHLAQRGLISGEAVRRPWWWLLQARDETWRLRAAVELRAAQEHGAVWSTSEQATLSELLRERGDTPEIRLLRAPLSSRSAE